MNRRGFLKGLALLGVSAAVADKLVALAEEPLPAVIPTTLSQFRPPVDVYWLQGLHIVGCEDIHRPVEFGLARGDQPLLKFGLSAYGGTLYWRAAPGEEIVVTRAHPLDIQGNFDGAAYAYGRTDQGPMMHEFIMTRGDGTVESRVLQLDKPSAMLRLSAA